MRAEKYATGAHVHTVANLLAAYYLAYQMDEFLQDAFRAAEDKLRAFASEVLLADVAAPIEVSGDYLDLQPAGQTAA